MSAFVHSILERQHVGPPSMHSHSSQCQIHLHNPPHNQITYHTHPTFHRTLFFAERCTDTHITPTPHARQPRHATHADQLHSSPQQTSPLHSTTPRIIEHTPLHSTTSHTPDPLLRTSYRLTSQSLLDSITTGAFRPGYFRALAGRRLVSSQDVPVRGSVSYLDRLLSPQDVPVRGSVCYLDTICPCTPV